MYERQSHLYGVTHKTNPLSLGYPSNYPATRRLPLYLIQTPRMIINKSRLLAPINDRYGTHRGLIRMLLAQMELATGRLAKFHLRRPDDIRRLVFVCQGNICRSSFAHQVAIRCKLPSASIGLSTSTGARSPATALAAASRANVDMRAHRATNFKDFDVQPGDLFLVMEVRQAHELQRRLLDRPDVGIALLGLWCTRKMPHLHDPFTLNDRYFDAVFKRIDDAVHNLAMELPHLTKTAS